MVVEVQRRVVGLLRNGGVVDRLEGRCNHVLAVLLTVLALIACPN